MNAEDIIIGGVYKGGENWFKKVLLISDIVDRIIWRDWGTNFGNISSWCNINSFAKWAKSKIN